MSESLEEERLKVQRQIEQLERTLSGAHHMSVDSSTDDEDDDDDDDEQEAEPVNDAVSLSEQRLRVQREIQQLESALGQDATILSDEDNDSDDDDDDESGSELDLPLNTESCLQMNMVYQQILQEKLQQLETLLQDNRLQQRELESQLSGTRQDKTSHPQRGSNQAKLFLGRFLKPYFKDKLTGLGPPANPESKEKARNMTQCLDSKRMKLKRWEGWQKTLLIHAVAEDRLKRLIKPKLNKIEYLTQKLSSSQKVDTQQEEDITHQIGQLEKDIVVLKAQNEEELVGDRYDNHDWEKISNIDFEGTREAQDICRFWQNVLHPSINKSRWGQEEIDRLEEISEEHQERDWDKIAQELGTNRTAFMCLQLYQPYISKTFKNNIWTEEEDEALRELVEKMRMGNFIPYTQMSYFMDGREPIQLLYRWNGVLDPSLRKGAWSTEEDELLLQAVSLHGEKNWWRIKMEVPGRTDGACRDRYYDVLKPGTKRGPFDENERRLLLMLVEKHGVGRWARIAAEIPNRFDAQCMRAWRKYSGPEPKRSQWKRGKKKTKEPSQQAAPTGRRRRRAAGKAGQNATQPPGQRQRRGAKTTKRRRKRIKREESDDEGELSEEVSEDESQLVYMDSDDDEDKKAVRRRVEERRRRVETQTQEKRAGEEMQGGVEVQTEDRQGGEEVQTEDRQGGEEVQTEDRQGGEEVQTEDRQGGEEVQTEDRQGGEEAQTQERRGVEKVVQTEERRGGEETQEIQGVEEEEVMEVQTVPKVKKEHPLPPMEEWLPCPRVRKCADALNGCLVALPEPCSFLPPTTTSDKKSPPNGVRCTIVSRLGVQVDSLFAQAPKPLPRWGRHRPDVLIQVSCTHLNYLMQKKASSVTAKDVAAAKDVDQAMQFRLMAAVTPWIGNLLLPTPWTRRSAADRLRERGEAVRLSSTSVFLLLLKTLCVDLTGCKGAIEERKSASCVDPFRVPTPKRERDPNRAVSEPLPCVRRTKQQNPHHVNYLLQQQQLKQLHASQQRQATRQPCPQSPQPHHLQLVMQQPKKSNTPPLPPVSPWMIPANIPPHMLAPIPPNMRLQYLPLLMHPAMCAQIPPLPFPLHFVPQTRQPLAGSMSLTTPVSVSSSVGVSMANTPVTMSPNTPVSVSCSTPVAMSNTPVAMSNTPVAMSNTPVSMSNTPVAISNTPVTMSNTPVSMSNTPVAMSNTPVSMSNTPVPAPSPSALQAVPPPHNPAAIPPSPNSSVSRTSAPTVPGQPSVPSETTSRCHSHVSSPAEETPSGRKRGEESDHPNGTIIISPGETCEGRKRQRKVTEKVKLLQEHAAAKVEAKEKKRVTPGPKSKKPKLDSHPDTLPPGQTLWKISADGMVQVSTGDLPPGLKLALPPIGGLSMPQRNVVFQPLIPSPNSSTGKKTQAPHSHHAPPATGVLPRSASSSPLPGGIHLRLLNLPRVLPPPGPPPSPSAGSSFQPRTPPTSVQPQAASTSLPYGIRPIFHHVQICQTPPGTPPGPSGTGSIPPPRPPPDSVQPQAAPSSSSLPVGSPAAPHGGHVRPGRPRGPSSVLQSGPSSVLQSGPSPGLQSGPSPGLQSGPSSVLQSGPSPGLQCGPSPGLQRGPSPGLQSGLSPGLQRGPSPGLQRGPSPGLQRGLSPGLQRGLSPGLQRGLSPGLQRGPSPGLQRGLSPGLQRGPSPGLQRGLSPGLQRGLSPGLQRGLSPGLQSGLSPGLQRGLSPGLQRGLSPGLQRGPSPGLQRGPSPGPAGPSFRPPLSPLWHPGPPVTRSPLALLRPGSPSPRFPGTLVTAAPTATPPRTPPLLLRIEPTQVDPSLMFTEPPAQVRRWMSGRGGVALPGSDVALPYLPPFISNLRTLCALLKARGSLVDTALNTLPDPDHDYSQRKAPSNSDSETGSISDHDYIQTRQPAPAAEEHERVAAVRHLVVQRFAANPAYQLLKARFLSCFTVPALLATIRPDSCTANEEEEEEEVVEEGLRGGEPEEGLRSVEEENVGSENPLLLMQGASAAHYSGMVTRRTSRLLATEPPPQTGPMDTRAEHTEPPQTGPMDTRAEHTEPPQTGPMDTRAEHTEPPQTGPMDTRAEHTEPPETGPMDTRAEHTEPPQTGPMDTRAEHTEPPQTGPMDTRAEHTEPPQTGPMDTRAEHTEPPQTGPMDTRAEHTEPPQTGPMDTRAEHTEPPQTGPMDTRAEP